MLRRDFLLMRNVEREIYAEVNCERLYMYFHDTNVVDAIAKPQEGTSPNAQWWSGEPPAIINDLEASDMLEAIAQDIMNADVLLVLDTQWLAGEELLRYFNRLVEKFIANGGRVEYRNQVIN